MDFSPPTVVPSTRPLPAALTCTRCGKSKSPNFYPKAQLEGLGPSRSSSRLVCTACLEYGTNQTLEMFCQGCEQWFPKTSFAKSMRKIPDAAKCKICTTSLAMLDPLAPREAALPQVTPSSASNYVGAEDDDDDDTNLIFGSSAKDPGASEWQSGGGLTKARIAPGRAPPSSSAVATESVGVGPNGLPIGFNPFIYGNPVALAEAAAPREPKFPKPAPAPKTATPRLHVPISTGNEVPAPESDSDSDW